MIVTNAIRCRRCNSSIESTVPGRTVFCPCGACGCDGGTRYLRRIGRAQDYDELTVKEIDGQLVTADKALPPRLHDTKAEKARRAVAEGVARRGANGPPRATFSGRGQPRGPGRTAVSPIGGGEPSVPVTPRRRPKAAVEAVVERGPQAVGEDSGDSAGAPAQVD